MRRMQGTVLIVTALLAGCGGGVPHGAKSAPPPASVKTASVAFHIEPTKAPASGKRRTKYVSYGTQSVSIEVSSPGLPTTTTVIVCEYYGTCKGNVDAPVATDTFSLKLYDDQAAHGNLLSSGSVTQTIVAEQANTVNITFDGIVAHASALTFADPTPLIGAPLTTTVTVNAVDAAGFTIIGPGNYDRPIVLTLNGPVRRNVAVEDDA